MTSWTARFLAVAAIVLPMAGCELVPESLPAPFETSLGMTFIPQPPPPGGVDPAQALLEIRRDAEGLGRPPDTVIFGTCVDDQTCFSDGIRQQRPLLFVEWRPRAGETASGTFIIDANSGQILAGAWSG